MSQSSEPREVLIYIHGVTPSRTVGVHAETYAKLHQGITSHMGGNASWQQAKTCFIEWGWDEDRQSIAAGHQHLATAQTQLAERMLKARRRVRDWTFNPFHWMLRVALRFVRSFILYGLPDVLYYVSRDGKNSVRQAVAEQIISQIGLPDNSADTPPLSLTFIGHSAGALVAFDLTFYLFYRAEEHLFLESTSRPQVINSLRRLRELAEQGKLRVRRLFTLGSPISLVPYRSNAVVRILADGRRLNVEWHGLTQNPTTFGEPLTGARWVNLWDRDDPIAWPAQPLIDDPHKVLQDIAVDISDSVAEAHNAYWDSPAIQALIAKHW